MKILRSPAETAIDDVLEACKGVIDHYRAMADAGSAEALTDVFRALHREHAALAEALEEEIRRSGNLPSAPDADREAVEHLATRVRAALSPDGERVLLNDSARVEEELLKRIQDARALEQPPRFRELLQRLQATAEAALQRLSAEGG